MKRLLPLLVFVLLFLVWGRAVAQGPGINFPPETEVLRGVTEIRGTTTHPDFWKYELAAAPTGTQNWFNIAVSETPVANGVLGLWDTRSVSDGTYSIRLRLVKRDGNYDEYFVVRTQVANTGPVDTPAPQETSTPTITPTPRPATATPVVLTPEIPTATPAPEATATPRGALVASTGDTTGGQGGNQGESLASVASRMGRAFLRGARIVLGIFIIVGVFFGVKSLITWLYYRLVVSR